MSLNFILKEYSQLTSEEKQVFFDFCRNASNEVEQPAAKNMWAENTFIKPWTLGYRLEKSNDFVEPNGNFYVLYNYDAIVACSGVYKSDFSDEIYIASTRLWIEKSYRNKHITKRFFFPIERKWALDRGAKIVLLSFNKYNKNIIEIFKRSRLGESNSFRKRAETDLFYKNFNELNFPVIIHGKPQWICYEQIDQDFEFDWSKIRLTAENRSKLGYKFPSKNNRENLY